VYIYYNLNGMALSNFISKLNWRLIIVHLVACGFFIYSFKMFSYLHDNKFLMGLLNHPKNWIANPQNWHFNAITLSYDLLWIGLSQVVGLLVGFMISLMITIKNQWYWVNSLIVFVLGMIFSKFNLFGWKYLKIIFLTPGSFFKDYSIGYLLVNGLVMLTIGCLLFFLRWPKHFINRGRNSGKQDEPTLAESDQ